MKERNGEGVTWRESVCVCAFGVGEFCFILMLLKPKKSLLWSERESDKSKEKIRIGFGTLKSTTRIFDK